MAHNNNRHARDFGGNGEIIVLLHGFLASSKYWMKLRPHLTQAGYRVIVIDSLGFGNAPKPRGANYDYKDHVAYIDRTIRQLGIDQPVTIIGHSMGALIAARYSNDYPDKVNSLVLIHPPIYKDTKEASATLRRTSMLYRFLLDSRYRRLGWMIIKTLAFKHIGSHSIASRERSLCNVIEKAELLTDLKNITTETMLIVGLRDRTEYITNLTQHPLSKSVTIVKEDVTHHSPIQKPDLILEKILQFI
jgi:pimeloyl-ACP methyl ester carboxylesterase